VPEVCSWAAPEPAWWLNLQALPAATVQLHDRAMAVRGRAATGPERERLWTGWREYEELDGYAIRRPGETAIVVLESVT